ncbi:family 16 glycosylhydrolase [Paraglaciecola aquimarina]|uniref:Family 16 glycosylhydrolase n=1 Tax=Paraglaciecola aquimarina TaxID=1235557 RepID=A0ABU3SVP2_9ALTE|nr:family 16 glycosylhydrolase [Paraglaciecola aquimarina]MDU0354085.1 family 16 glycosylhydrolase [Paraglaciecola aquimarina]
MNRLKTNISTCAVVTGILMSCNSVSFVEKASAKGGKGKTSMAPTSQVESNRLNVDDWHLVWNDEFDYANDELEKNWISQNGATEHPLVASSRWRENAVVENGELKLITKKETRAGQDWTSGNVWTKQNFGYGYFEARYKYAAAPATNNSFWLWPKHGSPKGEKQCEVDINEGHYPNVINSNVHNWTDKWTLANGKQKHYSNQIAHTLVGQPEHNIVLDKAISTNKIRLTSKNPKAVHLREFRVFPAGIKAFPDAHKALDNEIINYAAAADVTITNNGTNSAEGAKTKFSVDNNLDSRWISRSTGKKWIQYEWADKKEIGGIQLVNGLLAQDGINNGWLEPKLAARNLMTDFTLEYFDGQKWQVFHDYQSSDIANFGEEYHTYGVAWDEDFFRFYFDGELYYTLRNDACFSETTILFSLAILKGNYSGEITDALDGTAMTIDYVRYYQAK